MTPSTPLGFLQERNRILAPPPQEALQSSHRPHSDQSAVILLQGIALHFLTSVSPPRKEETVVLPRARTLIPPPQEAEQAVHIPHSISGA